MVYIVTLILPSGKEKEIRVEASSVENAIEYVDQMAELPDDCLLKGVREEVSHE